MYEFGLKLWSTNENYVDEAVKAFEGGFCSYIELYVVPGSLKDYVDMWKRIDIPYVIHAPHFMNGMNLAVREKLDHNMLLAGETLRFADELGADIIILHPGIAGDIKETAEQINKINDNRLVVENKPYCTIFNDGNICNGNSPEEIEYVLSNTNAGFCLDIGHCIYAANARKVDYYAYLKRFLELGPKIFHLTDGECSSTLDKHYHIGEGDFEIEKILALLPDNAMITIETKKDSKTNLDDFSIDIERLRSYG